MALFQKGQGGRAKGSRNKLGGAFLEALAKDFLEHGAGIIEIVRMEHPEKYISAIVQILPREFEVTENALAEVPDAELDQLLEYTRQRIRERASGRKDETLN